MDGLNVGDFSGADYGGHIQVAVRQLGGTNADGLVGKSHVERVSVGFAVDRNRANAQLFAGTDDPQSDFSTIGDQNFFEHAIDSLSARIPRQNEAARAADAAAWLRSTAVVL